LITEPAVVRRLTDLVSGAENRYVGALNAPAHPLVGHWVPDFAVANGGGTRRIAELARDGRPLLIDLTERGVVAASADLCDRLSVVTGRAVGDVAATALLVRPDGYVAWATSSDTPDIEELRRVVERWFGIRAPTST
jgi:hypothetical protein